MMQYRICSLGLNATDHRHFPSPCCLPGNLNLPFDRRTHEMPHCDYRVHEDAIDQILVNYELYWHHRGIQLNLPIMTGIAVSL